VSCDHQGRDGVINCDGLSPLKAKAVQFMGRVFRGPLRRIQFFFPLDLAREFVRPRQRRLTGEGGHQNRGAGGVGRTNRKLQSIAQERSHFFMLCYHVDRWLPPPCRHGRSILFWNGSPLRKFANSSLELKLCSRMHLRLEGLQIRSAARGRQRQPMAEARVPAPAIASTRPNTIAASIVDKVHGERMWITPGTDQNCP
jgi:hypothetical protein